MPACVNTPRSEGSARRSETTICIEPVSSTAVRPMRTRTPVAIGPVTVNSPSVIRATEQRLALRGLSVADDDPGAREMRDVGLREAAEHRRVQYDAALLGLDRHVHHVHHWLTRRRVLERAGEH